MLFETCQIEGCEKPVIEPLDLTNEGVKFNPNSLYCTDHIKTAPGPHIVPLPNQ